MGLGPIHSKFQLFCICLVDFYRSESEPVNFDLNWQVWGPQLEYPGPAQLVQLRMTSCRCSSALTAEIYVSMPPGLKTEMDR